MSFGGDLPGRRDPVLDRYPDVDHCHVGSQLAALPDRAGAVTGLASHLDAGFGLQDHPESGTHKGLVIGQQDP